MSNSDEQNTLPTELSEDSTVDTSESQAESQADSQPKDSDSEKEETLGDLEPTSEPKQLSKTASDYASEQENVWTKKIVDGNATIEELSQKQPWLAERVKKNLGVQETKPDVDVLSVIKQHEATKQFNEQKTFVESLPVSKRNQIVREANELKDLGLSVEKALAHVLEKHDSELKSADIQREVKRRSQAIPSGRQGGAKTSYNQEDIANLSQADYNKVMAQYEKGDIHIES